MGIRLSLEYSYQEFKNKVKLGNLLKDLSNDTKDGIDNGDNKYDDKNDKTRDTTKDSTKDIAKDIAKDKLPFMFGSECPGWTCYAEKKEGDFAIPYMSKIKSPQQIQGNIIKNMMSSLFKIVIIINN